MDTLPQLRQAARRLLRSPLFTITSLVTLAVGIGANTAIFSVVNGVLLRPLSFEEPDRLVALWYEAPGLGFDQVPQSPATYLTTRSDAETLEDVALWAPDQVAVTGLDRPEQVDALMVTAGLLPILRVHPRLGRLFSEDDDAPGAAPTVMISHGYWQRAFGGEPDVLGRMLEVDGRAREIVGVLPEGFRFLREDPEILYTARFDPAQVGMGNFSYQEIGRLAPGATVEKANAEAARLLPVAADRYPGPVQLSMLEQARFAPLIRPLKEDVVGDVRPVLWVLLGTVGIVLLIACANVANLFLVRAEGRVRDVAVRTALGAGRGQVASHFLLESLLLGLGGGAVGLVLAWGGLKALLALAPDGLPRLDEIALDPAVLAFTLGVSVLAGLLFGAFPMLRYGRPDLTTALKDGSRGSSQGRERHRARNGLVVAQVALALVLLVGSGLMMRSFQGLRGVRPGFEKPGEVFTFRIAIPQAEVEDPGEAALAFEQVYRNLEAIPGVRSVSATSALPMGSGQSNDPIAPEDHPVPEGQIPPIRRFKWVMPGYDRTLGIPLVAGRFISWADLHDRALVAVVSENLAREYWDDPAEAVGKRIRVRPDGQDPWKEIVGVVGDVREDGVDQPAPTTVYWPQVTPNAWADLDAEEADGLRVARSLSYVIRAEPGALDGLLGPVQKAVWSVDPDLPLYEVRTLDALVKDSLARTAFTLVMLGIAAGVALLLGAVGIYGVISYTVSQRRREIGLRMALGAERGHVRRMVVGQGMVLAGIGVALGLVAAFGLSRLMGSLLYGVEPADPVTYAAVAVVLGLVALLATWVPAVRATRVDPAETLRSE